MLKLGKVVLDNWCQHKALEVEFAKGLNGIMGRNGAGKSNLLRAIRQALLPSTSTSIGVKEDDVSWGEDNGKVVLENFELDGRTHTISRHVKGSAVKLTTPSGKISGITAVDAYMQAALGVGAKVMSEVVFVSQGRIEDIVFQRPAERTKTFHSLLGLDAAEKIRILLAEKLSALPTDSNVEYINRLEQQKQEKISEKEQVRVEISALSTLTKEERRALADLLNRYERFLEAKSKRANLDAEVEQANKDLQSLAGEKEKLEKRVGELGPILKESKPVYDQAIEAKTQAKARSLREQEYKIAMEAKRGAEVMLAGIDVPVLPSVEELTKAQSALVTKRVAYRNCESVVNSLSGKPICPTCRQAVSPAFVEFNRQEMIRLNNEIRAEQEKISLLEKERWAIESEIKTAEKAKSSAASRLETANRTLARIGEVNPVTAKEIEDYTAIIKDFDDLSAEMMASSSALALVNGKTASAEGRLKKAKEAVFTIPVLEEVASSEVEAAKAKLHEDDAKSAVFNQLKGRLEALTKAEESLEASIVELKLREKGLEGIRKLRSLFEEARGILHRDQLPAMAARAFLKSLNAGLNDKLQSFDVDYSVRINDDLSFECLFPHKVTSADRLSGGKKVALAVSMRFALHDLLAGNLGLLVLDEPTTYLDDDNIECLVDILEKVKVRAHASGLQIIVVTHEKRLERVFDKVIRL